KVIVADADAAAGLEEQDPGRAEIGPGRPVLRDVVAAHRPGRPVVDLDPVLGRRRVLVVHVFAQPRDSVAGDGGTGPGVGDVDPALSVGVDAVVGDGRGAGGRGEAG